MWPAPTLGRMSQFDVRTMNQGQKGLHARDGHEEGAACICSLKFDSWVLLRDHILHPEKKEAPTIAEGA